jgi:hypothetical protein
MEKVKLRADNLPDADPLNVLDLFHGNGLIWNQIKKQTGRDIRILGVDQKPGIPGPYLQGNNLKFKFDYDFFHVVDCDAYGSPIKQIADIVKRSTKELYVFVTFIQTGTGRLPKDLLLSLGYTRPMLGKAQTIFNRHGQTKLLSYLGNQCIKRAKMIYTPDKRKTYLCFKINEK